MLVNTFSLVGEMDDMFIGSDDQMTIRKGRRREKVKIELCNRLASIMSTKSGAEILQVLTSEQLGIVLTPAELGEMFDHDFSVLSNGHESMTAEQVFAEMVRPSMCYALDTGGAACSNSSCQCYLHDHTVLRWIVMLR